jgi:hypothetical protein
MPMFTQLGLQARILGIVVLAEALAIHLSAPYWRDYLNPFGLF